MKKRLIKMIALLLTLLLLLSGCGKPEDPSKAENSEKPENTGAHVTMPDGTEPDSTEPSASEKLDLPKETERPCWISVRPKTGICCSPEA